MEISNNFSGSAKEPPVLSVVIGIRNWGLDRLEVALRSHLESGTPDLEVIISDYGSANHEDVFKIAQKFGCKYIYSEAAVWSRSAALNAGIAQASSNNILTTDADIIFSPKSHSVLLHNLRLMPDSVQIIQCRDLPEGFGSGNLSHFDWSQFFRVSSIRPRWGMGGSATFTKDLFARVHGFDERMTVWGGEDNDFVQRARRTGAILNWIENPDAQIYHIWHPPDSRGTSAKEAKIVESNKKLLQEDPTTVRNLSRSYRGSPSFKPTVSVVIATQNRPSVLQESIASCLNQTFQDFELLIIDDGSNDDLNPMLHDFGDDRIKLLRLDMSKGPAFARNYATAAARGQFIAVHTDKDLMLPQRLEHQLGAIVDDAAGSYGGWILFDDTTGALTPTPGRAAFNHQATMFGRIPAHSTILIRRQVLERIRYNENFLADADHHILQRIARAGIRLVHCGHYVTLCRQNLHDPAEASRAPHPPIAGISDAMIRQIFSPAEEHQHRKSARAIPQATIPFSEIITAARHLPSRLLVKWLKIEFDTPLTDISKGSAAITSALDICKGINIEWNGQPKGIKAVTAPVCDEDARKRLISTFSNLQDIRSADEILVPAAYPDAPFMDEGFAEPGIGKRHDFDIGQNLEGALTVMSKHCSQSFLTWDQTSGYHVATPPLPLPIENLLQAKLRVFSSGRSDVEA